MVFRMFAYEIEDAAQSSVKGKTAAELIDPWFNYNQTPRDPALIAWSPEYDGNQDVEHELHSMMELMKQIRHLLVTVYLGGMTSAVCTLFDTIYY
jgi:hypothetical protein